MAKLGLKAQDTAELHFDDVRVPAANLLGDEGRAFDYLGHNLAQERLSIAVGSQAAAVAALDSAIAYVKERKVFGKPLSSMQNTKFVLAECATEIEAGQMLVDRALDDHDRGELTAVDAAKVETLLHRTSGPRGRQVPAIVRWIRLHARVPDRPALRRRTSDPNLRRHQRNHEVDHQQVAGSVNRGATRRIHNDSVDHATRVEPEGRSSPTAQTAPS